jgi:hypothetical protein
MQCDEIKAKGLLFKDRLRMLPQDKPLAEMSSDGFIAFADAWRRRQTPLPTWQHLQPRPRRGWRRAPASTAAAQPGTHNSRRHCPHAPAAAAQQDITSHPTFPQSPSPTHTRPSSTCKRTRIPDLNVPASSSRDKRRRPPSLPDLPIGTNMATTQTACGPLLPLFPLSPTSARTPDGQRSFNLCPSNHTQPQSPQLSNGNKRPRRVLDLNQPPSDSESEGPPLVHPSHIWKRPKER